MYSGTLTDGSSTTAKFCAYGQAACHNLVVEAGSYPSEISWNVVDGDGNAVASGVSPEDGQDIRFPTTQGMPSSAPTSSPVPTNSPVPSPSPTEPPYCDVYIGGTNDGVSTEFLGKYVYGGLDSDGNPHFIHSTGQYYMGISSNGNLW